MGGSCHYAFRHMGADPLSLQRRRASHPPVARPAFPGASQAFRACSETRSQDGTSAAPKMMRFSSGERAPEFLGRLYRAHKFVENGDLSTGVARPRYFDRARKRGRKPKRRIGYLPLCSSERGCPRGCCFGDVVSDGATASYSRFVRPKVAARRAAACRDCRSQPTPPRPGVLRIGDLCRSTEDR